jgi:hypothetical protein
MCVLNEKTRQIETRQGTGMVQGSNWVIEVTGSLMDVPIYQAADDETLSKALENVFLATLELSLSYERRQRYNTIRLVNC